MWYCPSCGKQNGGNASFCTECGQPRPGQTPKNWNAPGPQPYQGGYPPQPAKKKSLWWLWLILALAVVAGALVVCYFFVHLWTPATCTEPDTCRICGEIRGAPLGHIEAEPTCTEDAVCSRCGAVLHPALGHDAEPATCLTPSVCSRCGETLTAALGHDWQEATYDRPETCSRCGETRGELKGWVGDIYGSMGEEVLKLYGSGESHPYLLTEPLYKVYRMTLYVKLTGVDGDPYGTWGLYARDLSGQWAELTTFTVARTAYNNYVSFPLQLDGTRSFDALTMVPMTDADYSITYSFYYEDVQVLED